MVYRNYRQERAQKSRTRDERKQEKLRKREAASLERKALREAESGAAADGSATETGEKGSG